MTKRNLLQIRHLLQIRESEQEIKSRIGKKKSHRMVLTGLLLITFWACFIIQIRTTAQGGKLSPMEWAFLHQSSMKKIHHRLSYRPTLWRHSHFNIPLSKGLFLLSSWHKTRQDNLSALWTNILGQRNLLFSKICEWL